MHPNKILMQLQQLILPPNPNLIIPHCSPTESIVPHSTTPHFILDTHDLISPISSLPHPNTSTYDKLLHTPSLPSLASPKTATEIQTHPSLTSKSNAEVLLQPTTSTLNSRTGTETPKQPYPTKETNQMYHISNKQIPTITQTTSP